MDGLERELQRGLRGVSAPPELWDRVRAQAPASQVTPARRTNRKLAWAMAAAVAVAAVVLSTVNRESPPGDAASALQALASDSQHIAFRCQNPAQLRAWVRARTGLDLPLRSEAARSIQLIGAQLIGAQMIGSARSNGVGVEVAYRAGDSDAVLLVSRADAGAVNVSHHRARGNVSSWVMDGQRYTLACNDPAGLQLACKLCHFD